MLDCLLLSVPDLLLIRTASSTQEGVGVCFYKRDLRQGWEGLTARSLNMACPTRILSLMIALTFCLTSSNLGAVYHHQHRLVERSELPPHHLIKSGAYHDQDHQV